MATRAEGPVSSRRRGGPRGPGLVYASITVALLVLIGIIALTTRQPPPPTIVEFAPQAVEQIKDAPTEQSSEFGSGEGGSGIEGGAQEPGAPARTQASIDLPRVRRCVGNPPRQIEDPQSPPCVPYWDGDNGGKTWRGVNENEVRIYIPTGEVTLDIYPQLERFFNKRFEFYGRKLKFVYSEQYPGAGSALPADQKALAADADTQQVFASLRYRTTQGFFYHEELARREIPSVTGAEWGYESTYLRRYRPYLWQYMPEHDLMLAGFGEWACKRIAGKLAIHAGDPRMQSQRRTFGLILQNYYDEQETTSEALEDELERCGAKPTLVLRNPIRTGANADTQFQARDPVTAQNAVLQMQQKGVTSLICVCHYYAAGTLMRAASQQGYSPEWLFSSFGEMDTIRGVVYLANAPPEQMAHTFGVTYRPPQIKVQDDPHWWALKEADPSNSDTTESSVTWNNRNFAYRSTLLMASAIQMAGPKLTPETLERGLHRTLFPNPVHPNYPGRAGFQPSRYAMTIEGTEYWWSTTALHPYSDAGTGTPCYVNRKARYAKGSWPSGDTTFFSGACDSGR